MQNSSICIHGFYSISKKELIEGFITSIGVSSQMYKLNNLEIIDDNDISLGKFSIEFLPVSHVDTIPACGFIIKLNQKLVYYSGDANNISSKVINKIFNGEINRFYQDTCGLDYEGNNHLSLKKLCHIVPQEFSCKFYCMHLDKNITEMKKIKERMYV